MVKLIRVLAILIVAIFAFSVNACTNKQEETNVIEDTGETAGEIADDIKEAGEDIGERAGDAAGEVKDTAVDAAKDAGDKAGEVKDAAVDAAKDAGDKAGEIKDSVKTKFE